MKNIIIKVLVILVIIAISVFAIFIYSNAKEEDVDKEEKVEKEIDYMETKLTSLINELNAINLENYKIVINKIEEEEGKSNSSSGEDKSSEKEEGQDQESSKQETTITKMEKELIIEDKEEVNWNLMQGETEVFYSVWTTIVLDLYEIGVNSDQIVEFSKTLDQVLISIKNKDKVSSALNLAKLYGFLPEFVNKSQMEEIKKDVIQTKKYIINAYAYVETDSWDSIEKEVSNAENKFAQVVNDISKENNQRKFSINKSYILIGELKNSLSTKDKEIFYLKYKNLLEGLDVLI